MCVRTHTHTHREKNHLPTQTGCQFMFLSPPPECWDYRCAPPQQPNTIVLLQWSLLHWQMVAIECQAHLSVKLKWLGTNHTVISSTNWIWIIRAARESWHCVDSWRYQSLRDITHREPVFNITLRERIPKTKGFKKGCFEIFLNLSSCFWTGSIVEPVFSLSVMPA